MVYSGIEHMSDLLCESKVRMTANLHVPNNQKGKREYIVAYNK